MNLEIIAQLQTQLNQPDVLPGIYYRRNHIHYPLVCYVNNITGLYLTSNFDSIPLFISRAYDHVQKTKDHQPSETYTQIVMEYLTQMARFVVSIESVNKLQKELIPSDLL